MGAKLRPRSRDPTIQAVTPGAFYRKSDIPSLVDGSLRPISPSQPPEFLQASDIYSFIHIHSDTNQSTLFAWNFSRCTSYHEQDIRWLSVALEICKQISFPTMPSRRRQSTRRTEVLS